MNGAIPSQGGVRPARLRVSGLTRRYGDVVANDQLSLDVGAGEVVALLGENGAGKSTLLSILAGFTRLDSGEIWIDGQPVTISSPAEAIRAGIGTVFQHFALVPVFTVREQLRLSGAWAGRSSVLLEDIDLDQRVGQLSVGERQRLEIGRVLGRQPRLLLLDEPTSTLSATQVERLFGVIRQLRGQGIGVVFVTHKLPEALAVADRLLVLRHGAIVDEVIASTDPATSKRWEQGTESRLLRAMFGSVDAGAVLIAGAEANPELQSGVGRKATGTFQPDVIDGPAPLLAVTSATATTSYGRHRPVDITLTLRPGRVLAIVGIDGQGQRELAEMLTGYLELTGSVCLGGLEIGQLGASARQRLGVGYLTDDRIGEGGVANQPVSLNLVLKRQRRSAFQRLGMLRNVAIRVEGERLIKQWGITPSAPSTPMGVLSGGNMQKVLLGREMEGQPTVLVANNPAHGLDLRTQDLVWQALERVTAGGGGVVLLTPDITEALSQADEVAVLSAGRLSPVIPVHQMNHATVSRTMVFGW